MSSTNSRSILFVGENMFFLDRKYENRRQTPEKVHNNTTNGCSHENRPVLHGRHALRFMTRFVKIRMLNCANLRRGCGQTSGQT